MKKRLIKLLGGFTSPEYTQKVQEVAKITNKSDYWRSKALRKGDKVYINDKRHMFNYPYYLVEPYNGGQCWYVTNHPEKVNEEPFGIGALTENISLEPPAKCRCCDQILNR